MDISIASFSSPPLFVALVLLAESFAPFAKRGGFVRKEWSAKANGFDSDAGSGCTQSSPIGASAMKSRREYTMQSPYTLTSIPLRAEWPTDILANFFASTAAESLP